MRGALRAASGELYMGRVLPLLLSLGRFLFDNAAIILIFAGLLMGEAVTAIGPGRATVHDKAAIFMARVENATDAGELFLRAQ